MHSMAGVVSENSGRFRPKPPINPKTIKAVLFGGDVGRASDPDYVGQLKPGADAITFSLPDEVRFLY